MLIFWIIIPKINMNFGIREGIIELQIDKQSLPAVVEARCRFC